MGFLQRIRVLERVEKEFGRVGSGEWVSLWRVGWGMVAIDEERERVLTVGERGEF